MLFAKLAANASSLGPHFKRKIFAISREVSIVTKRKSRLSLLLLPVVSCFYMVEAKSYFKHFWVRFLNLKHIFTHFLRYER